MHQVYYQFHPLGEVFQGLPLCFQLDELLLTPGAQMSPWIHHCQPGGNLCLSQLPGSHVFLFPGLFLCFGGAHPPVITEKQYVG